MFEQMFGLHNLCEKMCKGIMSTCLGVERTFGVFALGNGLHKMELRDLAPTKK